MRLSSLIVVLMLSVSPVWGKSAGTIIVPYLNDQQHRDAGVDAIEKGSYREAVQHFNALLENHSDSPHKDNAHFYMGKAYFHLAEFDLANEAFDRYLQSHPTPNHFQETIEHKFAIAENYREGARRHAFGLQQMPKIASGKYDALDIYDEIIATVPSQDLAVRALYSKGHLLCDLRDHDSSIDSFRLLIRRFPRHELAPESYLSIMKVYLDQSNRENNNHDVLALAQVNLNKFSQDFPRDERIEQANQDLLTMKENYARGLYEMGRFYERTKKPKAAILYFVNAVDQFPDTQTAQLCRQSLEKYKRRKEPVTVEES